MSSLQSVDCQPLSDKKTVVCSLKKCFVSNSKQKDRVSLSAKQKRREPTRTTILKQFTNLKIAYPDMKEPNMLRNTKLTSKKIMVDEQVLMNNQRLWEKMMMNNKQIEQMINKVIERDEEMERFEYVIQGMRSSYHESERMIEYLDKCNENQKSIKFELQNKIDNLNYEIKKNYYHIGAEQNKIQSESTTLSTNIETRKQFFTQKLMQLQQMTHLLSSNQNQNHHYLDEASEVRALNISLKNKYKLELTHIFILRIQLNPNFYAGFNVTSKGQDRTLLLNSNYTTWDRQKQRKVTTKDVKKFIVIQLYKGWKNLLRKLSYQSTQYQVLFGQNYEPAIVDNLKNLIYGQQKRVSNNRIHKVILISSSNASQIKKQITDELSGFSNGLIQINSLQYIQSGDCQQLQIIYMTAEQKKLTEVYQIRQYEAISKEELAKLCRQTDHRIFCYIQIPLLIPKVELQRYEQIYELVRKRGMKR